MISRVTTKKSKVKILFISLRSDYGGGPTHMYDLVAGLNSSFERFVACPIQKPFYDMYEKEKITIFPLPVRAFSLISLFKLVCFTRRTDIDIIHSHGKGAGMYSRFLGIITNRPVIHTFHGVHYHNYNCVMKKLYFLAERTLTRFTKHIINVSDAEHEEGVRLKLFPRSKARVIYNGINIEAVRNSSIGSELLDLIKSIKKDNILICTVARFDSVKGIDVAIQAMKNLKKHTKNFKYVLIGDGELKGEIEKEISNCHLNDHVILLGFRDDVPGILKMMDIYLSSSRSESMSMTLLEAMSSGLPIVATDIPGNRGLVKNGLLAMAEDPVDITRKICMLIESSERRNKLAVEGRVLVTKTYPLEKMLRATEYLYYETSMPKELSLPVPDTSKKRKRRIGINASKYLDVNTGVGRYTFNLCRSASKTGGSNDYRFYSPGRMCSTFVFGKEGNLLGESATTTKSNALRILWEQIALPFYSQKDRLDLFHYTDHALSLMVRSHQTLITVHDIAYISFPNLLNKSRRIYKKYILKKSIKKADIVIADSYSTKRDIMEFFEVKDEKIKVVHLGVEDRFKPINDVEDYRRRNNLPSKVILNVGTLEPRKNVVSLIKAFRQLNERGLKDYTLVIAGDKGWLYEEIFEAIKSGNKEQSIMLLGVVRDDDLPFLYNCAELFVYPSLYEGFGLPPLEAMACGIPVITSNTSSLPEVIGDAGIMVEPTSVNSLCENMHTILTDKKLWHSMRNRGLERSNLFSWKATVDKLEGIYDELLAKN